MNELTPHKTIFPSQVLDNDSVSLVKNIMPSNIVNSSKLEEGGSQADTDGYLDICDGNGIARARITVQIKHFTPSPVKKAAHYDIPVELYAYAGIHKGEVIVFIACDTLSKRLYWKYISLEDVRQISESEKNPQKTYRHHFSSEEICTSSNVYDVLTIWKSLYDDRMASIKDERQLAESFASLQRTAFNSISTELNGIESSYISRPQVRVINEWLSHPSNGDTERVCLLVGEAGVGKSAVLKKVIDSQTDNSKKFLCIKADAIADSGSIVTLEKLRNTIAYFSVGFNEVIIIIDQIDALSQCLSNDRNHLNMMMSLLSSLGDWSNVRAIVSCRIYDLNYDSDLRGLKKIAKRVDIGDLTENEVVTALDKMDNGLGSAINTTTLNILKTVQYLDTFCMLYHRSKAKINFNSPVDLYDELWNEYIIKSPSSVNRTELEHYLVLISETIMEAGTLKPVLLPSTEQKQSYDYLASCGLIRIDQNTVSFFHQSFYDYVLARSYASSGRSLINDVADKYQGLEMRVMVKAVLEYERGHNGTLFADEARSFLTSKQIRLHIKLLVISILAFAKSPDKLEKKLVKDICPNDERLLIYFLRGVQDEGWFATIKQLVKAVLPDLKKDMSVFFPILACLSRYAFAHPEDVYEFANSIKDEDSRKFAVAYFLRTANDYRSPSVLKAYKETNNDNAHFEVELIQDALKTNENFAFEETSKVVFKYLVDENNSIGHDGYELVNILLPQLLNAQPRKLLPALHNCIVKALEHTAFNGFWGYTVSQVFNGRYTNEYAPKILNMYETLLERFSFDTPFIRPVVEELLGLNNETSISMAFAAIASNPKPYDDIVRNSISNNLIIEKYLHGHIEYFYLKMLKEWYLTLDTKDARWYQNLLLSFRSSSDYIYDKERYRNQYLCNHLWRDKWVLICNTLSEDSLIPEVKKCYGELLRRFGRRNIIERPDNSTPMAMYYGGVTSSEIYAKWPIDNWLNSFLRLKEGGRWTEGRTRIDLNTHADEFKKCVASNPDKFKEFVFGIFSRNDIQDMYKEAGLEGLLDGGVDPYELWPLTKRLFSEEYSIKNSFSFRKIAEYYIREENPYLDGVIRIADSIANSPYDDTRFTISDEDAVRDLTHRATELLNQSINSPQGRAVEVLLKASQIPERRSQIFGILNKMLPIMPECIKALCLSDIQNNNLDDETLFYPFMKKLLAGLGCEALVIRGGAIQWCFYHKNDVVKDYIDRMEKNEESHKILSQIYFYGLSSEKNRAECEQRLEKILKFNNENVVAKIVEVALESYEQADMREYSIKILERFASDDRKDVANAYCWYCNSLPVEAFNFYSSIAKQWAGKKHREIHSQLEYVKKCISSYPKECYEFMVGQKYSETDEQWIADDDVVSILLQIYGKLKEEEDDSCMNGIMDLFDEYIYRGNRTMMGALENIN